MTRDLIQLKVSAYYMQENPVFVMFGTQVCGPQHFNEDKE